MPRILALDLSTSTGYALFETTPPKLLLHGRIALSDTEKAYIRSTAPYPESYLRLVRLAIDPVVAFIKTSQPDLVVIEETNGSKFRYSQKLLEFLHHELLTRIEGQIPVKYISTSAWRKTLDIRLSKEHRAHNAKARKMLQEKKSEV